MNNIWAIFEKQLKDTFKNKAVLIQFVMFPAMTIVMENAVKVEGMPEHFFAKLFAVMYVGMAPLVSMASIISEEKEQNTLRVLLMSNVKPAQYLFGIGAYVWLICMAFAGVFCACARFAGSACLSFMLIMALGIFVSLLFGAAIGTWSRNQMAATGISVPVMMVFSFLPMMSMFNSGIEKLARVTWSGQLRLLIDQAEHVKWSAESVCVIALNALIAAGLFAFAYKKSGLE